MKAAPRRPAVTPDEPPKAGVQLARALDAYWRKELRIPQHHLVRYLGVSAQSYARAVVAGKGITVDRCCEWIASWNSFRSGEQLRFSWSPKGGFEVHVDGRERS